MNPAPSEPGRYRNSARQFVMFGIVGGSGMIVNMIVTVLMNKANGGTQNAQEILFPIGGTQFN
ncbi:MAG TPA: GtrA family protein, partial [Dietzia sp.]|nr:GtrA family protein [Dietzia sp.]